MKTTRLLGAALLATSVFLGACDDDEDEPTGTTNTATVRFVNATGQNIDVGMNNNFSGSSNIAYAGSTTCMTVNTNTPGLSFRQAGGSAFTPTGMNQLSFQSGRTYTVVLTGAAGSQRVQSFQDTYTGASGTQGGVRVINATNNGTNYNLYVGPAGSTRPTTATQTAFGQNGFSPFVGVNAGNGQVWLTTTSGSTQTDVTLTPNTFPVTANGYQTIVIADPATAGGALRSFVVNRCGT